MGFVTCHKLVRNDIEPKYSVTCDMFFILIFFLLFRMSEALQNQIELPGDDDFISDYSIPHFADLGQDLRREYSIPHIADLGQDFSKSQYGKVRCTINTV
jgi:hypothetical protein